MSSRRILLVANDPVGSRMAGPGMRYWHFARVLAGEFEVTLSVPFPSDLEPEGFRVVVANPWRAAEMTALARGFDAVVAQLLPVPTMRRLARSRTRAIYDLYNPWVIEELAADRASARSPRRAAHRLARIVLRETFVHGDAFLCASDRQRDFWLGWLTAAGRLTPEVYARDPSLRTLIDVVPFGLESEPPRHDEPVLRGVVPGIGRDDRIVLWGGGIWAWLDAETVIRAVARLKERRPEIRLFFMGGASPNARPDGVEAVRRATEVADGIGLRGSYVFFNEGWVPHGRRGAYLLESDVGVVAHHDDLETRLAFRTRLLDYFWAGLPVVTTRGDVLAEEVDRRGLGRTVAAGDVGGWAEALDAVLGEPPEGRRRRERALADLRAELAWPRAVEPLLALLERENDPSRDRSRGVGAGGYVAARLGNAVETHGVRGAAARLLDHAAARVGRGGRAGLGGRD